MDSCERCGRRTEALSPSLLCPETLCPACQAEERQTPLVKRALRLNRPAATRRS